jgi:hypothetical protein
MGKDLSLGQVGVVRGQYRLEFGPAFRRACLRREKADPELRAVAPAYARRYADKRKPRRSPTTLVEKSTLRLYDPTPGDEPPSILALHQGFIMSAAGGADRPPPATRSRFCAASDQPNSRKTV